MNIDKFNGFNFAGRNITKLIHKGRVLWEPPSYGGTFYLVDAYGVIVTRDLKTNIPRRFPSLTLDSYVSFEIFNVQIAGKYYIVPSKGYSSNSLYQHEDGTSLTWRDTGINTSLKVLYDGGFIYVCSQSGISKGKIITNRIPIDTIPPYNSSLDGFYIDTLYCRGSDIIVHLFSKRIHYSTDQKIWTSVDISSMNITSKPRIITGYNTIFIWIYNEDKIYAYDFNLQMFVLKGYNADQYTPLKGPVCVATSKYVYMILNNKSSGYLYRVKIDETEACTWELVDAPDTSITSNAAQANYQSLVATRDKVFWSSSSKPNTIVYELDDNTNTITQNPVGQNLKANAARIIYVPD